MRARGGIAIGGALAILLCVSRPPRAAAETPAPAPDPAVPWIELSAPDDGLSVEAVIDFLEVRGRAGAGPHGPQDLVLALDMSGSVFEPSGADLDGDGIVGRWAVNTELLGPPSAFLRPPVAPRLWTTDFDDIVLKVEVSAAKQLTHLLDPETTRVGLVKFGRTAAVDLPLGSVAALASHLDDFGYVMRRGTDITAGIEAGVDLLERAPPVAGVRPQRSILLLTDGEMTVTDDEREAEQRRLELALERARRAGVRVFTFGVGSRATRFDAFLRSIASATGGRHAAVPASPEIAVELPLVSLSGLSDVELRNETTGAPGRAVRVFPNGDFDGFVALSEGENTLAATATLVDGRSVRTVTRVRFVRPVTPSAEQLAAAESVLERLRRRTVRVDLARQVQVERRRRRTKEVEVEPGPQIGP